MLTEEQILVLQNHTETLIEIDKWYDAQYSGLCKGWDNSNATCLRKHRQHLEILKQRLIMELQAEQWIEERIPGFIRSIMTDGGIKSDITKGAIKRAKEMVAHYGIR